MDSAATFFARPRAERLPLEVAPRLASWMAADHPDQVRLTEFLDHAERLVRPRLEALEGPLSLSLDVGLPEGARMLDHYDLDNYLFPLVKRLQSRTGRDLVSVWATKSLADRSYVTVDRALPLEERPAAMEFELATTASSETPTYKQQVHDQLAHVLALPEGPLALELAFEVGPGRNWANLWKPTIDSLDPLLGAAVPGRLWHPRDGRIVELGLHCTVEPKRGNEVYITIAPRVLSGTGT
jgi:hypothetical protein